MKMYKKSDLSLVNGLLVTTDGDVVSVNPAIVHQANELETLAQKIAYLKGQPKATPMPSLDGFERVSDQKGHEFVAETPIIDIETAKTLAMMDELDDMNAAQQANEMLGQFTDLLQFVDNDYVLDCGCPTDKFDMPLLGNVLELTEDEVIEVIGEANGIDVEKEEDDEEE